MLYAACAKLLFLVNHLHDNYASSEQRVNQLRRPPGDYVLLQCRNSIFISALNNSAGRSIITNIKWLKFYLINENINCGMRYEFDEIVRRLDFKRNSGASVGACLMKINRIARHFFPIFLSAACWRLTRIRSPRMITPSTDQYERRISDGYIRWMHQATWSPFQNLHIWCKQERSLGKRLDWPSKLQVPLATLMARLIILSCAGNLSIVISVNH